MCVSGAESNCDLSGNLFAFGVGKRLRSKDRLFAMTVEKESIILFKIGDFLNIVIL